VVVETAVAALVVVVTVRVATELAVAAAEVSLHGPLVDMMKVVEEMAVTVTKG
jgi:hypothetical protein